MATKEKEPITHVGQWLKLFNSAALYRHEPSRLFEDYLDLVLCCMANGREEARYLKVAARYNDEELKTLSHLMAMHVLIHEHQVKERRWYDMLGDVYMELASRSKASRMGQFFTPAELCDMMAMMMLGEDDTAGKSICDPAVGSGRTLLAARALKPDLGLIVGADLDPICAKMCALNFWLHGVRGEVACMNSLSLEWRWAIQTHPRDSWPFVTFLEEDRKEESVLYVRRDQLAKPAAASNPVQPTLF
ncbi:MAG: SAM-dependent DNA methyltransferase [Flavobacteriales bacterium]|nr:SAM-dependent DNA methyltransferase [Flavobacteriales bacterium]